ncbi:MAG TPA: hypothetical protein DET40_12275 [Lentisphaeria bacterium]|nr:MAG: hypothetical protein A2X45_07825 [Lentisphaerae bacterium GWF2_50_93]HCE44316.1 hypothetical protein [Lentisphaeria bacterium]
MDITNYNTRPCPAWQQCRCNAPKAAVILTPWAIKYKDYDFKTGDEFDVSGFKNENETWAFMDLWKDNKIQYLVKEKTEKDKSKLLSKWNNDNN